MDTKEHLVPFGELSEEERRVVLERLHRAVCEIPHILQEHERTQHVSREVLNLEFII